MAVQRRMLVQPFFEMDDEFPTSIELEYMSDWGAEDVNNASDSAVIHNSNNAVENCSVGVEDLHGSKIQEDGLDPKAVSIANQASQAELIDPLIIELHNRNVELCQQISLLNCKPSEPTPGNDNKLERGRHTEIYTISDGARKQLAGHKAKSYDNDQTFKVSCQTTLDTEQAAAATHKQKCFRGWLRLIGQRVAELTEKAAKNMDEANFRASPHEDRASDEDVMHASNTAAANWNVEAGPHDHASSDAVIHASISAAENGDVEAKTQTEIKVKDQMPANVPTLGAEQQSANQEACSHCLDKRRMCPSWHPLVIRYRAGKCQCMNCGSRIKTMRIISCEEGTFVACFSCARGAGVEVDELPFMSSRPHTT